MLTTIRSIIAVPSGSPPDALRDSPVLIPRGRGTLGPMRLQPREVEAIRAAVREIFGRTATIRLFGSRARDELKGGDIDLLVEVEPGQASIANEQRLRDKIAPAVQDLRTDIILHERGATFTPLERIALRDGIPL